MQAKLERLAALLRSKKSIIAFTGAGISTDSGIPDFRSAGEGLWTKIDPELLSTRTLQADPALFYRYYRLLDETCAGKQPNSGHKALAELQDMNVVKAIVTQNIDGLHQAAGSTSVYEVHGNTTRCRCMACHREFLYEQVRDQLAQGIAVPLSSCCQSLLRPCVVLFGDPMTVDFQSAWREAAKADFVLAVGSSLTVYPAAEIPGLVGQFAIINRDPTAMDGMADLVIHNSISETLCALVRCLRQTSN